MTRRSEINWSKPYEFHWLEDNAPTVATDHYGLYMILEDIGDGRGKRLIYIGIVKSDRRDLYLRSNEHRKEWLHSVAKGQIFVKFGVVTTLEKLDEQLIEDIESTLVFGAQPEQNTSKKSSYSVYEDIIVSNSGHGKFLKDT